MALEDGACDCTGRIFSQITIVVLTPATSTYVAADGRHKKLSEDIRKMYECLKCGKTYIYNLEADEWRKP